MKCMHIYVFKTYKSLITASLTYVPIKPEVAFAVAVEYSFCELATSKSKTFAIWIMEKQYGCCLSN